MLVCDRRNPVDAHALEKIPLFVDLSRKEREKIARLADEVDVPAGYHLLDQGRFPHEFFVIEDGSVAVEKDGERVADLGPGDFFGEIAILEAERRTASVIASTPVTAIVMTARDFRTVADDMPEVAERIHAAIRERIARQP
jgi:CRP/FNR family cyclic AMP-dependent transcriptional regulator